MRKRTRVVVLGSCLFLAGASLASCGGGSLAPIAQATPTPLLGGAACSSFSRRMGLVNRSVASNAGGAINPNRLYVTYRASAAARAPKSIDKSVSATRVVDFGVQGGQGSRLLNLAPGTNSATAMATLRENPDVLAVSPTHYRSLSANPVDVVNDPLSDPVDQWYLYITKTNGTGGAWATTHGMPTIAVAIIDTGVDFTNTDLTIDYEESVVNGVTSTTAPSPSATGAAQDTNGHGTNVAGLAVAIANNGSGFAGVGYSTHLQAYRIFPQATSQSDCQEADTGDEAQAVRDAVAHGASVINISLGAGASSGSDDAEQAAVEFAIASNVSVVAANGNEFGQDSDGNQSDFPAAYPGVIAVGASAVTDDNIGASYSAITGETAASYSNSGPTLLAPGGDSTGQSDNDLLHWIEGYSTTTANFAADQCSDSGGVCRVLFNGTSQATPQVSGTIALILAKHGGAGSLTPAAISAILTSTADSIGLSATRQGAGRLDAAAAVAHP